MFDKGYTTSVVLIGQTNVPYFPPIYLHIRESKVLAWIHLPLVATLDQREILVATLNKTNTFMYMYCHTRENPVMAISFNQEGHTNLMKIPLKKKEHPIMTFTLNNREHPQS